MAFRKFTIYDFKRFAMLVLNFMFGNGKCCVCGNSTFNGKICISCSKKLYDEAENSHCEKCRICGKSLISEEEICMSCREERILKNSDKVVPVPPRPGKIRSRGWDQIEELSEILKVKFGYKVLKLLERTEKNQQKKLDRKKRLSSKGKIYTESKLLKRLSSENSLPEQVL